MKTLAKIIRREIASSGILSFARFMELALYHPNLGYYETQKDNVGRRGDFYTSVSAGELFGQLLAFQFSEWLEKEIQSQKSKVKIVEAGAHDGQLAKDILNWLQSQKPRLFDQIEYIIIEPSPRRQEWQRETLKHFTNVRWLSRFNDSTIQRFNGIIFSNELLDAFPVHRLGWNAQNKKWFEWGVAFENEKFVWVPMREPFHVSRFTFHPAPELLAVLPDGYVVEISPAAENWWREGANVLNHGKLLTIDYGLTDDEIFSPGRKNGTLRAFYKHHFADDLLANPGEQDLTAHANFSAIQKTGEAAGLKTETFSTQSQFLTRILEKTLRDKTFGEWTSSRARQFQTLTHPEHFGRAFRVLIQSR